MFRTIQTLGLLLSLGTAIPAATFDVGYLYFQDNFHGTGLFGVENLTGSSALPPDFPVLTDLDFSGTLTIRFCELTVDCSDLANVQTDDLMFASPFGPGTQAFSVATDRNYLFSEFTFSGQFLPASPFDVGGVLFQPTSQALNMAWVDGADSPTWLFSIEGREIEVNPIPEPSSLLLLSAGALLLYRRR